MKIFTSILLGVTSILCYQLPNNWLSISTYTVVAKYGTVKNLSKGSWLYEGSQFEHNDRLHFEQADARLLVVDEQYQTFVCRPARTPKGYALASSKARRNRRDGPVLNLITIGPYFSNDTIYIFDDQLKVVIDSQSFPQNDEQFFYLQFNWNDRVINKKLSFSGDTLLIHREDLFLVEGQQLTIEDVKMPSLFHYNSIKKTSFPVAPLQLVFLETESVKQQIVILLELLKGLEMTEQCKQVEHLIFNQYGQVEQANLENWLALHFAELCTP